MLHAQLCIKARLTSESKRESASELTHSWVHTRADLRRESRSRCNTMHTPLTKNNSRLGVKLVGYVLNGFYACVYMIVVCYRVVQTLSKPSLFQCPKPHCGAMYEKRRGKDSAATLVRLTLHMTPQIPSLAQSHHSLKMLLWTFSLIRALWSRQNSITSWQWQLTAFGR